MNYVSITWYEPENMGEVVLLAESEWVGESQGRGENDDWIQEIQTTHVSTCKNLLFKF